MSYNLFVKKQPKGYVMAKRLDVEKRAYVERIVNFMHKNHTTMWSLDETREKWRRQRAYDKKISEDLIHESILFMNLLDSELNTDFRKKMLNFISNYLCVYMAKAPGLDDDENKAYNQLNAFFNAWLKNKVQRKSNGKSDTHQKPTRPAKKQSNTTKPYRTLVSTGEGGKIKQEIVLENGQKYTYEYPDMDAYRKQREQVLQQIFVKQY